MSTYLVLIYGDHDQWAADTEDELARIHAGHQAFAAHAGDAIKGGHELQPIESATSLRAGTGGGVSITDGPFVESKEVLGGYYLLEAPDLDTVIDLARRLPEVAAAHSGVEIRPLVGAS